MKPTKMLAVVVMVAMVVSCIPQMSASENFDLEDNYSASDLLSYDGQGVEQDYNYSVNQDGTVTITKYKGSDTDVVIPSEIGGGKITEIGSWAFYNSRITSVKIPNSVTSIGNSAFYWCTSLTSVEILNSVTSIGDSAFDFCTSLTSVEIPDSVTSIGENAFHYCTSLTAINVAEKNKNYSSKDGVLFNKEKTQLIKYPIEKKDECYVIPDSVTTIGDSAFAYCKPLTSVKIPDSVTSIGKDAFYYCNSLTSVKIPNSVTSISENAFYYCNSLTSIEIPGSVTNIGESAFACCSLTSVKIPDSVTSIGESAFAYCSLTSVEIPHSVTSIGRDTFFGCYYLSDINVAEKNENYSSIDGVLFNKEKTELILYPRGKGESYTIPDGVTSIGAYAFYDCPLTLIVLPDNLISIGYRAFWYCTLLTSVIMPESTVNIDKNAFDNCSDSLTFYGISGSYAEIYANENNINFNGIKSADPNGDSLGIKVFIPVAAPTNTVFNVKKISETEVDVTYDIFLSADGKNVDLNGQNAIVKIPLPNKENKLDYKVYRKEVNGKYTDMQAAVSNGYFVFTTDYFGEYIITNVQRCNVARRTEDEIREYIKNHPFSFTDDPAYEIELDVPSNVIGKLDYNTLNNGLNALNSMRYIAGLADVELDENYCELAQAISFVNYINNSMAHYPIKPSIVSDEIYELAVIGGAKSNLGRGYRNPASSVIFGYMEDSDYSNIDRVGHRRWCLNPSMGKTGFGQSGGYSAMYAHDMSLDFDEYNVCWPAQTMPIEYLDIYYIVNYNPYAWSISIKEDLNYDKITVTLTRKSDSKVWRFSANDSDGDFYVNDSGYGELGCIIFRPDDIADYKDGDSFHVLIEGTKMPISYDVDFFTLMEYELGDVNHDKSINDQDSILLDRHLAEWGNTIDNSAADMNGDGKVNDQDSIILARTLAGWYD